MASPRAKTRTVRDVVILPNILSQLSAGVLTSSSMVSTYSIDTSSLYAGNFCVPLSSGPDLRTQESMVATTERRLQLHCDASDHLRGGSGLSEPVQPVGMTCQGQGIVLQGIALPSLLISQGRGPRTGQPLEGHSLGANCTCSPSLGPHPRGFLPRPHFFMYAGPPYSFGNAKPKAVSDVLSNSPRVLFVEITMVRRPRAERTSGCRFISHFSLVEDSFEYCPWHLSLRRCVKLYRSQSCFQSLCEYVPNGSLQDGNAMRGVERGFGMLFTPHGRLARHIRAPKHQRQACASTGKLGGIGRGKRAWVGSRYLRLTFDVEGVVLPFRWPIP